MATSKCVHKGCEKEFADSDEACIYHPGPPIFHEGQKGWKCCKPRVLTFDEFLAIPPCTTGKHSTVDDTPPPPKKPEISDDALRQQTPAAPKALPLPVKPRNAPAPSPSPAPPESESDDPAAVVPPGITCKRRGCNVASVAQGQSSDQCIYHPGQPLFHEGSKGWTCCKKKVLEFDEFLKIQGCRQKARHLFLGRKKEGDSEEKLSEVRHDFYQTPTSVIASLYLKKIIKDKAKVEFIAESTVALDLPTSDNKRYQRELPLFGTIDTKQSSFKIMGTKLELNLIKTDGRGWPTLRSDEQGTGEIIQTGGPARA